MLGLRQDLSRIGFGENVALICLLSDPVGAHFDLFIALFAGNVQHFGIQLKCELQEEGRLPNAGLPADQHQ